MGKKYVIDESTLSGIADSIRAKKGTTADIVPEDMPEEIASIEGGGGDTTVEDGLIEHTLSTYSNDRVTSIGYGTFHRNVNLKSISFPNVTSVNNYAFWGCKLLSTIDIPKLQTIGSYAFNGNSVVNLVLPELITAESYAFGSMLACKTVVAPKLVTVGANCFRGVNGSKLQKVDFGAVEELANNAFYSNSNLDTLIIRTNKVCTLGNTTALSLSKIEKKTGYIYVPETLVEQYKAATNWATYASQFRAIEDYPEICGG